MENFDGLVGAITTTVYRDGLKKDTTLSLIVRPPSMSPVKSYRIVCDDVCMLTLLLQASEDIGRIAVGVLKVGTYRTMSDCLCVFADHVPEPGKICTKDAGRHGRGVDDGGSNGGVRTGNRQANADDTKLAWQAHPVVELGCEDGVRIPEPKVPRVKLTGSRLKDIESRHEYKEKGAFPTFEDEWQLAKSVCKMQSFEEWTRSQKEKKAARPAASAWNNVSLFKLLTGRS